MFDVDYPRCRKRLPMLTPLVVLASVLLVAASPQGQDMRQDLREAEHQNSEQLVLRKDADNHTTRAAIEALRLAQERVEAAAKLRLAETATAEVAARIDALAQQRRDAERRLKARAEAMQPLLPLIERLSLYPAETLLAVPASPERGAARCSGAAGSVAADGNRGRSPAPRPGGA